MTRYFPGDVVIASMDLRGQGGRKSRPAVVIGESGKNSFLLCPVTSRLPDGSDYLPIGLDDFEKGGLDLFEESYVLVSDAGTVGGRDIHGKKGRLKSSIFLEISGKVRL
ncbi:MAG: type II toxin-antitoxin system PemK/MazF family toxin [Methanomicrobiaceae archaeon]|nr:type II toxin-antitoxin system PemK/MazF family toxin [Methanomicrobiaceae archaeon]